MSDFNVSSIASAVIIRNNEHVPTVADLPFDMNFETGKHFQRQSFTVFASTDRSQGVLRLHQIQSRHTLGLERQLPYLPPLHLSVLTLERPRTLCKCRHTTREEHRVLVDRAKEILRELKELSDQCNEAEMNIK